ncbi:MAG TPA: transketolase [Planctomycetaceae bacterium]|nr:transketolase [Planctomycetaceae bacterium]HRF00550.1 transketolase [Pirellulaceae bacterium]
MSTASVSIEQLAVNTIRTLSMDGVQAANSGHPGTPMALAPVTYAIWNGPFRYDPTQPLWPARDRFVLSCGHASMLLYSILHLAGVRALDKNGKPTDKPSLTLDDLKNFRQLGSPCAGHPEYGFAAGIETTTGPLGQGIATSVGMAMAAKWFAARYDRPGFELFDYDTYVLCSDGDVMEGVGCEAASLAGHLGLSNLCWIYDDNRITIEGETELAFSEDVATRFRGLGWNTVTVEDANDLGAITAALDAFRACDDKPTLIVLRSIIGYGSPNKANSHAAHGAPLGEDEIKLTKRFYGWPEEAKFLVPDEVRAHFAAGIGSRGAAAYGDWQQQFAAYAAKFPTEAAELRAIWNHELPAGWEQGLPSFPADAKGLATRVSSGKVLNALAAKLPWMVGGSADLAPSTMTMLDDKSAGHFSKHEFGGRNLHFGIREHAMAAACNGLSLSGIRSYCATFFVFSDYLRPSLRLSSLMHQGVIYVLTHDSIGLGEDGPTHQPVEHLAACRAIPGVRVFRPSDANEVSEAYRAALADGKHPAVLVLTRQNVPTLDRTKYGALEGARRGGYVLAGDPKQTPQVILLATGSEIPIALAAHDRLTAEGIRSRVVSMLCFEIFDAQDAAYRESVLPAACTARVGVEAGIRQGWDKYLGTRGEFVGMSSFGASGPFQKLYEHFGITPDGVVAAAKRSIG